MGKVARRRRAESRERWAVAAAGSPNTTKGNESACLPFLSAFHIAPLFSQSSSQSSAILLLPNVKDFLVPSICFVEKEKRSPFSKIISPRLLRQTRGGSNTATRRPAEKRGERDERIASLEGTGKRNRTISQATRLTFHLLLFMKLSVPDPRHAIHFGAEIACRLNVDPN